MQQLTDLKGKIFIKKCDYKTPTLVVIKSDNGNIFGGFTSLNWDSNNYGEWKHEGKNWLFILKGQQIPQKIPQIGTYNNESFSVENLSNEEIDNIEIEMNENFFSIIPSVQNSASPLPHLSKTSRGNENLSGTGRVNPLYSLL